MNFTAFDRRLKITCLTVRSSAMTVPTVHGRETKGRPARLLSFARSRTITTPCSSTLGTENRVGMQLDLACLHLREVQDVVDERKQVAGPFSRMSSRYSACFSLISPNSCLRNAWEKPLIAFKWRP